MNGQKAWVVDITEVEEGSWNFRQLFVNGERRPRTRLTKAGFYQIESVSENDTGQGQDDINGDWQFVYVGTDIQPWYNLQDVEIVAVATCTSSYRFCRQNQSRHHPLSLACLHYWRSLPEQADSRFLICVLPGFRLPLTLFHSLPV